MKTDVFHLAETLNENIQVSGPQVDVDFDIQTNIRRPGITRRPRGLPKQEMKMK